MYRKWQGERGGTHTTEYDRPWPPPSSCWHLTLHQFSTIMNNICHLLCPLELLVYKPPDRNKYKTSHGITCASLFSLFPKAISLFPPFFMFCLLHEYFVEGIQSICPVVSRGNVCLSCTARSAAEGCDSPVAAQLQYNLSN